MMNQNSNMGGWMQHPCLMSFFFKTTFVPLKSLLCTPWRVSILVILLVGFLSCIPSSRKYFVPRGLMSNSREGHPELFEFSNPESQCSTNSALDLLPLQNGNSNETTSAVVAGGAAAASHNDTAYEVCVVIVIGHDSAKPSKTALPFSILRRLFQAVFDLQGIQGEVGLVEPNLQGVLVRVDYTSIVCNMVRDALGHSATCQSLLTQEFEQQARCKTLVVGETKKYVQQACANWTDGFQYENLKIVDLDKPDPLASPQLPPMAAWRPTIVTGFSRNHLRVGLLLMRSVGKSASNPIVSKHYNVSLVVWVMEEFNSSETNYFDCQVWELKEVYHIDVEVRKPDFTKYPVWMRINPNLFDVDQGGRGEYAWKAIFVHTVLLERGFVLWLDGGGRIVTPTALLNTLNWTKKNGFACCGSGDTVKDWTHPGELKYFQADFQYLREQENCDASRAGFTVAIYNDLIRPWYECSITRQCIAPDGSNRYNHRQDQAALTVLSVLTGHLCTGIDYKGITRHNDYNLYEFSGVDNTTCYKDPLLV
ncbi:hypothetical protein CY35_06G020000 [Sphagnum magellanicum]|nr:hypothetical protein CY35_06G020000 [Sphagnum magellanicum]